MKRKMLIAWIGVILSFVLIACGGKDDNSNDAESSAMDEKVNLRISSGLADTHQWILGYFNPMLDEVSEKLGDNFEYDLFTSEELVETTEELEALNSGTIDIAIPLHPIYDPERFPLAEVTMLPVLESDVEIATEAFNELILSDDEFMDGMSYREYVYEQHDLKVLPMVSTQPYVISTTNQSINSVDDLKGLKLRSGARVHDLFLKNLNASPISLPFPDLYDGLSKGTLDGTALAIPDWTSYGIEKLFSFTLEGINLGHYSAVTAMKKDTWDSLPDEAKDAFEKASQNQLQSGIDNWYDVNEDVVEMSKENGAEFVDVSEVDEELQSLFTESIGETWEQWIEDVEKQDFPAKEAAILWRDLFIEAGGTVPDSVLDIE